MKYITNYIITALLLIINGTTYSQKQFLTNTSNSQTLFIENKGQILDQYAEQNNDVLYLLPVSHGFNIHLRNNSFSYETYSKINATAKSKQTDLDSEIYTFHRIDMKLKGANQSPKIIKTQITDEYLNFYTHASSDRGINNVCLFNKITYKDIYPNIDIEFIALNNNSKPFKYNFIIKPGGDISQIVFEYQGANKTELINNEIHIHTNNGIITEHIPFSFLQDNTELNVKYVSITTNTFAFIVSEFDKSQELTIDPIPELNWSTYFGGKGNDGAFGVSIDSKGNVYVVGETSSATSIATSGAHQNIIGGNSQWEGWKDAFIVKFNGYGKRLWGTYFGGTHIDYASGICIDNQDNLFVVGTTRSTSGIASNNGQQTTFNGDNDAFLVKFNQNGSRIWGTYFGGSNRDIGNSVAIDKNGNIYIAGETQSTSDIATNNSFKTKYSGNRDAFLAKYNNLGILLWSTYFGDTGLDRAYAVTTDNSNNIIIAGITQSIYDISTDFVYQTEFGGGLGDGFLTKFDIEGNLVWSTYYGGTLEDEIRDAKADNNGNIYITGWTESSNKIATPNGYQKNYSDTIDAFIAKFDADGKISWGTYYGGKKNDYGISLSLELGEYLYVVGQTASQEKISSKDSYQNKHGGGIWDVFVTKFSVDGTHIWGTYYGGSENDFGKAICADKHGSVFIAGETKSLNAIATYGTHQTNLNGNNPEYPDAFVAKFSGTPTNYYFINANICEGETYQFDSLILTKTGEYSQTYTTSEGTDSVVILTLNVNPLPNVKCPNDYTLCIDSQPITLSGASPSGGTYSGMGVSGSTFNPQIANIGKHTLNYEYTDKNSCTNNCSFEIFVVDNPITECPLDKEICIDDTPFVLTDASPKGGTYSGVGILNGVFDPKAAGIGTHTITYIYTVGSNCSSTCTFEITVNALPTVQCPLDIEICINSEQFSLIEANPQGGTYSGKGVSSNVFNPQIAGVGVHTITYTYSDNNNCVSSCTFTITVHNLPQINCPNTKNICINSNPFQLSGASPSGGIYYISDTPKTIFNPIESGIGNHLINYSYTNKNGCSNTCSFVINVHDLPELKCPDDIYVCFDSPIFQLEIANPSGGSYSGQGITNNFFNPSAAGVGTHPITYTYTDEHNCISLCQFNITVNPKPDINCPPFKQVCVNYEPFELSGANPKGGVYSGKGVVDNTFIPQKAGIGAHTITYQYTDNNSCSNTCTTTIIVHNLTQTSCPTTKHVYIDTPPLQLQGASPIGGIYSGNGVINSDFYPQEAGIGNHIITYTHTNQNNCTNTCEFTIQVHEPIELKCPENLNICINAPIFQLSLATPEGGNYSGNGVADNQFIASIAGEGTHKITYTHADFDNYLLYCDFYISVYPQAIINCPENLVLPINNGIYEFPNGIGGTYSGNGIQDNKFNPEIAGFGLHTITYTHNDAYCSNECQFSILVFNPELINCYENIDICINDKDFELKHATPLGGIYSGNGINYNIFSPQTAGIGTHTITYTYNDEKINGDCSFDINVYDISEINCPENIIICKDNPPITLVELTKIDGIYSGNAIYNNVFYPSLTKQDTVTVQLSTKDNICSNSCQFNIIINPLPELKIKETPKICFNSDIFEINVVSPEGGIYDGNGIIENKFNPNIVGIGSHNLTYSYTDENNCTNFCNFQIQVNANTEIICPQDMTLCFNQSLIELNQGFPIGGIYSGIGVENNFLNPQIAGTGKHSITNENGCEDKCMFAIDVLDLLPITCTSDTQVCINAHPFILTHLVSGNVEFSGKGVINNTFYPNNAGVGKHEITATNIDICSNSCTFYIVVNPLPEITCPNIFQMCANSGSIELNISEPIGGTYLGNGITNNIFNPSNSLIGTHSISYYYVDSVTTCSSECYFDIIVNSVENNICPDDINICSNDLSFELQGAYPANGIYIGNGVENNWFYPELANFGDNIIKYVFSDFITNCADTCVFIINVSPIEQAICPDEIHLCENDLPFLLTDAYPEGGMYSGAGIIDAIIYPSNIGVGTYPITYTYTDSITACISQCKFEVIVHPSPIIHLGNDTILYDNQSIILDAGNDFIKYIWNTNDTTQTITINANDYKTGLYEFYVSVMNEFGCISSDTITIEMIINYGISTNEAQSITIFPNPNDGRITITTNCQTNFRLKLQDLRGKVLYDKTKECEQSNYFDFRHLAPGMYFVELHFDNHKIVRKIIVSD